MEVVEVAILSGEVCEPTASSLRILDALDLYVNANMFEVLLQVWIHNCFEHSESPLGSASG